MDVVFIADFGSSNIRVHAIDVADGHIVTQHSMKYPILSPQSGYFEHDPEQMWQYSVACMRGVLDDLNGSVHIHALSFSHIGSSLVPMDAQGRATYNCILGMDSRAGIEGEELRQRMGDRADGLNTSFTFADLSPMAKTLYLRKHMPQVAADSCYYVSIQQYILSCLGLDMSWDATEAGSHSCFDNLRRQWSLDVLEAAQINPSTLGRVVLSHEIVGTITHYGDVAFSHPVPVVIGGHDAVMGTIGMGVFDEMDDAVAEVTGSVDVFCFLMNEIFCYSAEQLSSARDGALLMCEPGPLKDTTMCLCGLKTAGAVIEWFLREMCGGMKGDLFADLWGNIRLDGKGRVSVHPNFADAAGGITGLDISVTKYDVFKACIEAITYEICYLLQSSQTIKHGPCARVRIGGGHANADRWVQFRADLSGRTYERMSNNEASALGTAVLAAYGVGLYPSIGDAVASMVRIKDCFVPNPEVHEAYREKLQRILG